MVLLILFSSVLTWYLTRRATRDVMSSSQDTISQMYSATNYILNDAYDSFFQLYQTVDMNTAMFAGRHGAEDERNISGLFQRAHALSSCVDSIYIVNRTLNKVYTDQGVVSGLKDFYDPQALQLFDLYNENSPTIFLPRSTTFTLNGKTAAHTYVTLIFARTDAFRTTSGGFIVNIDQSRLNSLITADLSNRGNMYIVTSTGSILSNSDPARINTTLQGTRLWERITADSAPKDMVFTETYGGRKCIVTSKKSDRLLFYFLCIVPTSETEAKVAYIRSFTLGILAVLTAFSFLFAMVVSRRIYHPISSLVANLRGRNKGSQSAPQPDMNEFDFLNSAYRSLCGEVESLASDKSFFARAQTREIMTRLLRGEYPSEKECREQLKKAGVIFPGGVFLAAVVGFDAFAERTKQSSSQDVSLYKYAVINVATELLGKRCGVLSMENGRDSITLILNAADAGPENDAWLRAALRQTGAVMRQHLGFTVTAGVGTAVNALTRLSASYESALTALSYRVVLGRDTVIFYREIAARQDLMPEYPIDIEAELIQAIRSRGTEKAGEKLDEFFSRISVANTDYINMSLSQLVISLNRMLKQLSVSRQIEREYQYRTFSANLHACDCLEQKKDLLRQFCEKIILARSCEMQNKKNDLIERTCEYIRSNYANPMLEVENIAEYAELSSSYLRTIFKDVTGRAPNEYITEYRMQKARELLGTTDYTTKEIAAAVGYLNHRYFYSVFKAKVGCTPTDYRKRILKEPKGDGPT